jgi:hypothetical protein
MDDPQSLNWTRINEMAAALTQEQRDLAEWKIANSGKIVMQDFKVNRFGACRDFQKLNVLSLDIYRAPVRTRISCFHRPHRHPDLVTQTNFPGRWLPHRQLHILGGFNSDLLRTSPDYIPGFLFHEQ